MALTSQPILATGEMMECRHGRLRYAGLCHGECDQGADAVANARYRLVFREEWTQRERRAMWAAVLKEARDNDVPWFA